MIRAKVLPALSKACMCHAGYKKNLFRRHFPPDAHILSQTGAALTSSATQISARRPGDLFYHQVNMTPPWLYLSRTACFQILQAVLSHATGCGMRHSSCTSANLACDQDISTRSGFLSVSKIGKDSIRLEPMKTIGSTDEVARENQGTMDPVQLESRALVPRCPI